MHRGLTVFRFLKRALSLAPNKEIVHNDYRQTYRETYERIIGLANSLISMGYPKEPL